MTLIDVKKAYDSVDHGWLNGIMLLHKFPVWLCRVIAKLCRSWNTSVMVVTRKGRESSEPIRINKGLPQGDALYPRLFTVCLQPIVWKVSATKGYKLSKPISFKVTDLSWPCHPTSSPSYHSHALPFSHEPLQTSWGSTVAAHLP